MVITNTLWMLIISVQFIFKFKFSFSFSPLLVFLSYILSFLLCLYVNKFCRRIAIPPISLSLYLYIFISFGTIFILKCRPAWDHDSDTKRE